MKYDLLSNTQPGINYPQGHLGAFVPQRWEAGHVNNELQEYIPEAAEQNKDTGEITIDQLKGALAKHEKKKIMPNLILNH